MTLSDQERERQEKELLSKLALAVGDGLLVTTFLLVKDFPWYAQTTWRELSDSGYIKWSAGKGADPAYRLTPVGWRKGLEIAGKMNDPYLEERLGKVLSAAKELIGDRSEDKIVLSGALSSRAEVPDEWFNNVIDAELIEYKFKRKGIRWQTPNKAYIRIPINVGMSL